MGGAACQHPLDPSSLSAPQEAAHKRLMCRRQACEAQTPELLRRHRSLTAHSLLPLAEKQRRVLRNLRRLEGLGLVSARDGYQGLVDELAKVTVWREGENVCVCACVHMFIVLTLQGQASPWEVPTQNCHQPGEGQVTSKGLFEGKVSKLVREGSILKMLFYLKKSKL